MQIYTGTYFNQERLDKIVELELGILLTPNASLKRERTVGAGVPIAYDNGAYSNWINGTGFDEYLFLKTLSNLTQKHIPLEFIVCPDIVAGGMKSYDFSMRWKERLAGFNNLYLAVQDGMPTTVNLDGFAGVMVGGSTEWKWRSAGEWADIVHSQGKRCHIARTGSIGKLKRADELGADSCDSTSFIRNGSWDIVGEYRNPKQMELVQ